MRAKFSPSRIFLWIAQWGAKYFLLKDSQNFISIQTQMNPLSVWHALGDSQVLNDGISIIGSKQTLCWCLFKQDVWIASVGEHKKKPCHWISRDPLKTHCYNCVISLIKTQGNSAAPSLCNFRTIPFQRSAYQTSLKHPRIFIFSENISFIQNWILFLSVLIRCRAAVNFIPLFIKTPNNIYRDRKYVK